MTRVRETAITIPTRDNIALAATLFEPIDKPVQKTMVIGSALGVPRYFYYKLAHFFAENQISVLTFDYRGIHESRHVGLSGTEMKMEHWGSRDIEAALNFATNHQSAEEIIYLGHSCGGQLVGLAPSCMNIDKMVLVACQHGDWRLWPRPYRYGVYLTWKFLKAAALVFDYVPTRLLGIASLDLPAGVAAQWAAWGETPDYLFNPRHSLDTSRYGKLTMPLLSYSFKDDLLLGPPRAVDALLNRYESAAVDRRSLAPEHLNQQTIGHWGFFKERLREPLWHETLLWIQTGSVN